MDWRIQQTGGYPLRFLQTGTVVVGSGAAGLNAADQLWKFGCTETILITEGMNRGTSRNTGSDKQTYYKLTLSGEEPDSVGEMAKTLFDGHCVDGDIALAEAANSAPSFLRLCELGVPFPVNRFGEYVGYKTDHDPRRRATSVGPLTSRKMTEALERSVRGRGIPILDGFLVLAILTEKGSVKGVLCLDLAAKTRETAYAAICCANVIWATGGPAGMYADSAYPKGHYGMTGVALEAGAAGRNLTEWQYGLASLHPRWNVSGSYMQVLPRFYSTDLNGENEREFLLDFFPDKADLLTKVFLKGYQWPFDARKIQDGSSIIDLLVYMECCLKGRRVFLDYTQNPGGCLVDFDALGQQARAYLQNAGADFGTPIQRLQHMNAPAAEFYRNRGVDLAKEPLEVAVCAQHNNGGLDVDVWWQTGVEGLFAAGEAAGTHGVYRPGGSALNAGQVGSLRAARFISAKRKAPPDEAGFETACGEILPIYLKQYASIMGAEETAQGLWAQAQKNMSRVGGPIRDLRRIQEEMDAVRGHLENFCEETRAVDIPGLGQAYHYRDALICQLTYLGAMADYIAAGGKSRGSAMYRDDEGARPYAALPELFTYALDEEAFDNVVQLAHYKAGRCTYTWRPVRPIPREDDFFENVWRDYREDGNVH
ncbi:FAD-binding protein [Oscillibacter sp.]|uniref:FAD-binding protein n=1 Tax=Oscillibacter sp. TaxID=1945593 RepID=UPI0026176B45|nr:FAD-binding protein [Oscillibacter sp.]MDD3347857.1 FAD-binding protein [Oscillibacter sp.]